ncbi:DUF1003 domain-containing protein [Alteromonas sp. KUL49]|uniref:DUF1003 domain-containing protein n=1 Tax=Alteromonas sp. KUL49 TaxID=2480798 RepID=UPI00102F243F|nr:DUF1003 domain-containing protein [Alteromonas sp. KUL49]TAP39193.1 DUF1003 domain-containing protein [Alteromonas sp. KUL49]GEA11967.1 cyclic nucleotide-binding protein [Alteromonas sp. KUL49]
MKKYFENLARALLGMKYGELSETEQHVIESIANSSPIATNVNKSFDEQLSFGERLADKVAEFGGSWTFILIFVGLMIGWMGVNIFLLTGPDAFDPFPFILLNLMLSTLAALQAPIIMMSQNRQSAKDRLAAAQNYEVSLKTDLEIMRLHQKLQELTDKLTEQK